VGISHLAHFLRFLIFSPLQPDQCDKMPAISASAPGKIILFGEHAVVYGRPALAVPVEQIAARAVVIAEPRLASGSVRLQAPGIGLQADLADLPADHPLGMAIRGVLAALEISYPPAFSLRVTSTIPLAAGLGSGAAVSVAIIRAVACFMGRPLPDEQVSALAFEVEKRYHGTPSGIDNTVIAFRKPVYFIRGQPIETLHVAEPFTIVIGDTGVRSPTAIAVGELRCLWQADPQHYETLFDAAGQIAQKARALIESGRPLELGPLMDENHHLLQVMQVSSPQLDRLVGAARSAGALGAKLSGGGRGGNMIALVESNTAEQVASALQASGATRTLITHIRPLFTNS
jgi:mevalonate kinase